VQAHHVINMQSLCHYR